MMIGEYPQQSKKIRRIFFALWPAQVVRDSLRRNIKTDIGRFMKTNQVRKVPSHNWHLTLAFVGNVSDEIFRCCLQQGDQIGAAGFTITLNKYDYFEKSKIVWLGCDKVDNAWYELVNDLNDVLASCGYKPDRKRPIPHVSVLRKAKQPMTVNHFEPVVWNVSEFALIESTIVDKSVMYKAIKHWPLK